jgi:hypothetical protein
MVDRTLVIHHSVVLSNIPSGKKYQFRVSSSDARGNTGTISDDQAFSTPGNEKLSISPLIDTAFLIIAVVFLTMGCIAGVSLILRKNAKNR